MREFPWRAVTHKQHAIALEIRNKMFPRYRSLIRVGLLGPRHIFTVFVSKSAEPPDYGPESVDLSDCHPTPKCKYSCGGRYSDGEINPIAPDGSACEDSTLYFYKDIVSDFPSGQRHVLKKNPCVEVRRRYC